MFGTSWTWVAGAPLIGTVNAAPTANAGVDQTITLPATALLVGTATDDGIGGAGLSTTWSKTSGPGTVSFFNPNVATTTATFSAAGTYVLTLTANDGDQTSSAAVTIQVNAAAGTKISSINSPGSSVCSSSLASVGTR